MAQRTKIHTLSVLILSMTLVLILSGCSLRQKPGNTLTYTGPIEHTLPMGEGIPGTDIRYVGFSDAGAEVVLADQRAVKKPGDSLDWKGTLVPGVHVTLAQRVVAADAERLQTVGTIKLVVQDATPEFAPFPDRPTYSFKVPVTYAVKKGQGIPGTQITYAGKNDQGARLDGVSGYPDRKLGDSISWSGRLSSNAYLDTTLRVVAYTDEFLQVAGLAELGLTQ